VIQAGSSDEESDAEASGPQAFANQAKDAFERAQKSLAKAKELVRAGKMVELQKEVAEVARFGKAATKAAEGAEEAEQDEWKEPSAGAEQAVQEAKKYATMAMNLAQEAKAILDDATRPT
jgi:3-deoxy-D-arabino-heptulosonate 7-phosphate (DAHP) synthase class II